jgi:hypothetical protein
LWHWKLQDDPQKALKLANTIADGIIARHDKFFDGKMQRYSDYKKDLEISIGQFTGLTRRLK